MGHESTPPWVKQLDGGVIGKDISGVGLVYAMTLKVDFTSVLAILRVKGVDGYRVCFVGGRNLESVARKIQPVLSGDSGSWREDKYA